MAAARVWPEVPIYASDIDPVAVEVAEANVAANGLAGRVRVLEAAGLDHPELQSAPPFRLVFANILKGPLIELAPAASAAIAPGGRAILSGLLAEQSDEVAQAWEATGLIVDRADEIAGWTTLCLRKS
jgi:ribosomal protein L11 methyltransferase